MTGLTGNDYISNLEKNNGTGYANQVRAIVEGRAPYPTGMLFKTPYGQQLATDVTQADPTFETGNAQSRNTLRTNAKSGPLGKSTNAMNAAIVHLNEVVDNTMKLPNGNYPIINGIKKTYTDNTGGDSYTNFNTSMGKIASELTTAYRNGGGNEADILRELGNINPSSSPTQILGSLLTSAHLLKGKIIANQKQVDEGMGPMGEHINMVPAEVDQTIARLTALHDKAVKGLPLTEDSTQTNSDPALAAALAKYQ